MRPTAEYDTLTWASTTGYSSTPAGTTINKASPLKDDPEHEFMRFGILKGVRVPYQYINWQLNAPALWFKFLDYQYGLGDIYTTALSEGSNTIEDKLPGDWVLIGTKTILGVHVIQYWRRTDTPEDTPVRPTLNGEVNYYPWAEDSVAQVVITPKGKLTLDNKAAPLSEHTSYGLAYNEPINGPELNYQFDGCSKWYNYLDQRYNVGTIRMTISNDTEEVISNRWGGTWSEIGTDTVNTQVVRVLRKVSEDEVVI